MSNILKKLDRYCSALRNKHQGATVLVAMSGGVDSSVAAYILSKAGLEVIGVHFRLVNDNNQDTFKGCCHMGSAMDVQKVCDTIDAKSYVWNLSNAFQEKVIQYFEDSYLNGETPNPCIECNRSIKWGEMWDRKQVLGVDFVSTGHYVRNLHIFQRDWIARGIDTTKDQSYALWVIPEEKRKHTIFPLGMFHKKEIRFIADYAKLPTAKTPESQDICFLGGTDYRVWLSKKRTFQQSTGFIKTTDGQIVGQHSGVFNYTVGQRKGLGGGFTEPQYVVETRQDSAEVIIGSNEDLLYKEIIVRDVIGEFPDDRVLIQVRYKDLGAFGHVSKWKDSYIKVRFENSIRAPAVGQSAVGYIGDRVIFGGIIHQIIREEE